MFGFVQPDLERMAIRVRSHTADRSRKNRSGVTPKLFSAPRRDLQRGYGLLEDGQVLLEELLAVAQEEVVGRLAVGNSVNESMRLGSIRIPGAEHDAEPLAASHGHRLH